MTFQERVIAEIKRHFPDSEFKSSAPFEHVVSFGLAETKQEGSGDGSLDGMEFVPRDIRRTGYESEGSDVEESVIKSLGELKFYRHPHIVYIRLIDSGSEKVFETGDTKMYAIARFSLGYKS